MENEVESTMAVNNSKREIKMWGYRPSRLTNICNIGLLWTWRTISQSFPTSYTFLEAAAVLGSGNLAFERMIVRKPDAGVFSKDDE